jgi:hypothetical protein
MNRDQFAASWVLIAGSILLGVWYWRLLPEEKLSKLGRTGTTSGGTGNVLDPFSPPPGSWVPRWGDSENARKAREKLEKQTPIPPRYTPPIAPFDAGKFINSLAGLFVGN